MAITRRNILRATAALPAAAVLARYPRARLVRAQGNAAYDVIDFGPFELTVTEGSWPGSGGVDAMNGDGLVCGRVAVEADRFSPATWSATGKLKRLKSGQGGGHAYAVNAAGTVVGAEFVDADRRPMLWRDGERILLPGLDGAVDGVLGIASDLNDDEVITGFLQEGDERRTVRWVDGVAGVLPDPPGGRSVSQKDIITRESFVNARGTILGSVTLDGAAPDAVVSFALWRDDEATVLTLPDEIVPGMAIVAVGLDDDDAALFSAGILDPDGTDYLYVVIAGDETTVVDRRDDGISSFALDLNNRGDVVGQTDGDERSALAVLWRDGEMTDLNTLMPEEADLRFFRPEAINDAGMIAGEAFDADDVVHGILLVPVDG